MIDTLYTYLMMSTENNLKVDENYLRNLLNFFVRYYHLTNYIKKMNLIYEPFNEDAFIAAEYGYFCDRELYEELIIKINLKGILEELEHTFSEEEYFKNFSEYEKKLYAYTHFIETIAHEVRHARDLRTVHSVKDSLDKKVLYPIRWTLPGYEDIPNFEKLIKLYEKYYELCPTERLANFESYNLCYELLKKVPEGSKVRDEYLLKLLADLLNPYMVSDNPTKYFYEKAHAKKEWKKLEKDTLKLSLEKKLIYGFEIPEDYYNRLQEESFKLD